MCDESCDCGSCSSTTLPIGPIGPAGPQGPQGPPGTSEDAWQLIGNDILPGEILGTTNNEDLVIVANSSESVRLYSTGEFRHTGQKYITGFGDVCKNDSFNNTTDPLIIPMSNGDYSGLSGNQLLNAGIYIQIDEEIMKCVLRTDTVPPVMTLERGAMGTTITEHTDNTIIYLIVPYAIYSQNQGRVGIGTENPTDALEVHLKNGLNGLGSWWRDDIIVADVTETRGKGRCMIFFNEGGAIHINPYNFAGFPQDPEDTLHLGRHSGGFYGGIILDATQPVINFRHANGLGGIIKNSNPDGGWIQINGSSTLFDLSGEFSKEFRIIGNFEGEAGKGLHLLVRSNNDYKDAIRILNTGLGSESDLEIFPGGTGGTIKIKGLSGVTGTFDATNTVTVTNGIITGIV